MWDPTQKLCIYTNPDGHRERNRSTLAHGFAHTMYIKIQYTVMCTASSAGCECRSRRGCSLRLWKWNKFRGHKCLEIASLSQRPPKHTESYSSHLYPHLQTNFSHSWYSKQTSFWMETYATLITYVHTLCTHMTTQPPTTITLCLQFVFSGRSRSRLHRHNAPKPSTSTVMSLVFPCLVLASLNTGR